MFNEDKKTDLIGEAWINLEDVVVPGGGRKDAWHGLNCKGKYAGEIRLEMSYYDTRPKAEKPSEKRRESLVNGGEDVPAPLNGSRQHTPVKRRPLPTDPTSATPPPLSMQTPDSSRPKPVAAGPRSYEGRARGGSIPPEHFHALSGGRDREPAQVDPRRHVSSTAAFNHQENPLRRSVGPSPGHIPEDPRESQSVYPQNQWADPYAQQQAAQSMPDFLPELPPSSRHRSSQSHLRNMPAAPKPSPHHVSMQDHVTLPHSHSAPAVPTTFNPPADDYDDQELDVHPGFQPLAQPPPQSRAPRQRRYDVPPGWQDPYVQHDQQSPNRSLQPTVEDELDAPPPLPPTHRKSISTSAPHSPYGVSTGHSPEHRYSAHGAPPHIPAASPLQSVERYGHPPSRGQAPPSPYTSEYPLHYEDTPAGLTPGQQLEDLAYRRELDSFGGYPKASGSPHHATHYSEPPSAHSPQGHEYTAHPPTPYSLSSQRHSPRDPPPMARHSVSDPYALTPTRPHPLSQEVRRSVSPLPHYDGRPASSDYPPQHQDYRNQDPTPLIKPRAISPRSVSPQPAPRKSLAEIRYPVQTFASQSSTNLPEIPDRASRLPNRSTPTRKSVSPRPSPIDTHRSSVPFSPDSFDTYNPSSRASPHPVGTSQHSPYHVKSEGLPQSKADGPIVGFDGRVIDPSDHLPVDSWAPEPEKKTPTKTYGNSGRSPGGVGGPRTTPSSGPRRPDVVINVRHKSRSAEDTYSDVGAPNPASGGRNRLAKNPGPHPLSVPAGGHTGSSVGGRSPVIGQGPGNVLREIDVPNPYTQGQYSPNFATGSPGISQGSASHYDRPRYDEWGREPRRSTGYDGYGGVSPGYAPPPNVPPKIPIDDARGGGYEVYDYGASALSRELSTIDIGESRRGSRSPGGAMVARRRYGA